MSFLGVIILSFAFKIFDQRRLMVRHAPEILGACAVSAAVSMVGTALLCRLAGLNPGTQSRTMTAQACFLTLDYHGSSMISQPMCNHVSSSGHDSHVSSSMVMLAQARL